MEAALFANALQLIIWVAFPTLAAVLAAGVLSGVLQTLIQVSDEAIGLSLRVIAAAAALYFFSTFTVSELQEFASFSWGFSSQAHMR